MKNQPLYKRLGFAWDGIKISWQTEKSFRFHVAATSFVILLLLVTRPAPLWWAILLLTCGLVLALELVNTAVEKLVDHLHPDLHPAIKITKDALAGAVLIASLIAVGVFAAFMGSLVGF
ncbi:diacylglycerol kinase [Emcibacter nanhaiensis]|uniref:Diacylglycerol kinase n=1 Tax=Emcibacter nanhaiensis TaxID=1505037 RepID=A0A501PAU8_9PROT|nr:diacylglycerol kinase [Emcibacter nanhaiensis]TPD57490.1 diacylglycerol kinase [Emcibacter nanhaiensis]